MEISSREGLSRSAIALSLVIAVAGIGDVFAADSSEHYAITAMQARERAAAAQRREERTKEIFAEQDKQLEAARAFREEQKYESAVKIFEEVSQQLSGMTGELAARRRADVDSELKKCRREWGETVLRQARAAAREERYTDAIAIAAQAQTCDLSLVQEVGELAEYCRNKIRGAEVRSDVSFEKADPEYKADHQTIVRLLAEAQTFYRYRRYEEARNRLEQVFLIDPYNSDAIFMMQQLYNQFYLYGQKRHEADVAGMVAYANWQWAEPVFSSSGEGDPRHREKADVDLQDLYAKMERIVFPSIEIEDADIKSVINLLEKYSKIYDSDHEGIKFNSSLPQAELDALGDRARVSVNFSNIPMSEVLRYICQDTGLKYRIDDGRIKIGVNVDDMQTRAFDVEHHLIAGIEADPGLDGVEAEGGADGLGGGAAAVGGGEGGGGGQGGEGTDSKSFFENNAGTGRPKGVTEAKLKKYFEMRGVKFGPGSSISYDRRRNQLRVKNTIENLSRLANLIREINKIDNPLIMVEIKGVEISEADMQELGFDWSMTMLGSNMDSSGQRTDSSKNGWAFGQGSDRSQNIRSNWFGIDSTAVNNWNIFPALFGSRYPFGSDLPLNISLTIHALSRNERTETLSAPKVVTDNGEKAYINMVKAYYFPTDWETYEIENDNGDVTITVPQPEFDDETEIGIIFDVTPRVNPDYRTIMLDIDATVTNYLGRDNYPIVVEGILTTMEYVDDYNPVTGAWLGQSLRPVHRKTKTTFNTWMPIISRRNVRVNVAVADGETIVLGGMVDSSTRSRTDKWPVLGDLPFVGRFFQSQTEELSRSNLLIFVTARLINHKGRPHLSTSTYGAPDFNR